MEQEAMYNQNTGAGKNAPPDFSEMALFLAKSYGQMLKDRERLKAVIDAGVPVYTKEMAIRICRPSALITNLTGFKPATSAGFRSGSQNCLMVAM